MKYQEKICFKKQICGRNTVKQESNMNYHSPWRLLIYTFDNKIIKFFNGMFKCTIYLYVSDNMFFITKNKKTLKFQKIGLYDYKMLFRGNKMIFPQYNALAKVFLNNFSSQSVFLTKF